MVDPPPTLRTLYQNACQRVLRAATSLAGLSMEKSVSVEASSEAAWLLRWTRSVVCHVVEMVGTFLCLSADVSDHGI